MSANHEIKGRVEDRYSMCSFGKRLMGNQQNDSQIAPNKQKTKGIKEE